MKTISRIMTVGSLAFIFILSGSAFADATLQPLRDVNPVGTSSSKVKQTNKNDVKSMRRINLKKANNIKGRCVRTLPLDKPNMRSIPIITFATNAAIASYSYNFVNYKQSLQRASNYYTDSGWKAFMKGFDASNNLQTVIDKKLVVSAVPTEAPIIVDKGVKNSKYSWTVSIPLLVTYQSANEQSQERLDVKVVIVRTGPFIGKRGVGVQELEVKKK